jgi:hypothetical protein
LKDTKRKNFVFFSAFCRVLIKGIPMGSESKFVPGCVFRKIATPNESLKNKSFLGIL